MQPLAPLVFGHVVGSPSVPVLIFCKRYPVRRGDWEPKHTGAL